MDANELNSFLLLESYCLPATTESTHSFSFLVEQLNNCDIKEGDSIVCDNGKSKFDFFVKKYC